MTVVANPGKNTFYSGAGLIPSAHWLLDEYSGTRFDSAYSNNMTSVNNVESAPGIQGRLAAKFLSSKSQYLTVTDSSTYFTFGAADWSVGFWCYPFSTSDQRLLSKWGPSTNYDWLFDIYNGKIRMGWRGSDAVTYSLSADTLGTISSKKWYFVCGRYEYLDDRYEIYVNGKMDSVINPYYTNGTTAPLNVGRDQAGILYYSGLIADIWVYDDRRLTDHEVAWMHYYGLGHVDDLRTFQSESSVTPMTKPPMPTIHLSFNETSASSNREGDRYGDSTDRATQVNSPSVEDGVRKLGKTTRNVGSVGFTRTSSQYLRFDNIALTTLGGSNASFEIAFWFQPHEVATDSKLVSKWDAVAGGREFTVNLFSSKIRFAIRDYSDTANYTLDDANFGTLSNGVWYYVHVYYQYSDHYCGIGINDIWTTGFSGFTSGVAFTTTKLHIGRDTNLSSAYFDGYFDQLAIWRGTITPAMRTWNYNYGHGRSWADHKADAHPLLTADKSFPSKELLVKVFEYHEAYHADPIDQNLIEEDIKLAAVVDNSYSLSWTERYNDINDFEWELPISYMNQPWVKFGNIISIGSSDRLMVIEDMRLSKTGEEASLIITGRGIETYLEQRVLRWPWTFSGPAELLIYWLVEENMVFPTNEARRIESFVKKTFNTSGSGILWPPQMPNTDYIDIQLDHQTLLEAIKSVSATVGFGWKIVPYDLDGVHTELYFHVYKGKDRSVEQTENTPVVFSDDFDNVIESSLYHSVKGEVNSPLILNNDETVTGLDESFGWFYHNRYTKGASEPIDRHRIESVIEKRIDRDVDGDGTDDLTDDDVSDMITATAREEIANNFRVEIFDGEFDTSAGFIYGDDYELGDIVQCRLYGKDIKARILEVVRSWSTQEEKVYMALSFINN